ncbi:SIR2 family protein [Abyssisolibacter fermentans]|uniref:SIR2 family protein n=1 Tax=Abyssisolibacter fermentans TaxID=1766203 RepID=UPI000ACB26C4|nr:SIR2 family protein [Abyssisolibacter fermentans]
MNKFTHDPSEYIRGLQQLLVSDKKKIAFLFGAGTSLAKKNKDSLNIPAIGKMTEMIENEICKDEKYSSAIKEIKEEIGKDKYNVETLLSNVQEKYHIIGNGTLNGLKKSEFESLIKIIKDEIKKIVCVHKRIIKEKKLEQLIHLDFAEWIGKADRKYGVEIFTTNYDYLFELGMEEKSIPYYDGFSGSYEPFFYPESVDDLCYIPKQTKLWKIHGSLGWHLKFDEEKNLERVFRKDSSCDDILIYPSTLKYADSKKQPYIALMDRLTNFLKQPDTILIVCGYSFGDLHINERILTALKSNTSAHVYVLFYDIIWNGDKKDYGLVEDLHLAKLAKTNSKISVLGCRNAVIGCKYGKWKLKREPDEKDTINVNLYFDEDGPTNLDDPKNEERNGEEIWTGEGELTLPDFLKFVKFLQSMIMQNHRVGGQDK